MATTAFTNPLTRKNEQIAGLKNEWKLHLQNLGHATCARTPLLNTEQVDDYIRSRYDGRE